MARAAEQGDKSGTKRQLVLSRPQDQIIVVGEDWQTTAAAEVPCGTKMIARYVLVLWRGRFASHGHALLEIRKSVEASSSIPSIPQEITRASPPYLQPDLPNPK